MPESYEPIEVYRKIANAFRKRGFIMSQGEIGIDSGCSSASAMDQLNRLDGTTRAQCLESMAMTT
jgi:hypothetical protein